MLQIRTSSLIVAELLACLACFVVLPELFLFSVLLVCLVLTTGYYLAGGADRTGCPRKTRARSGCAAWSGRAAIAGEAPSFRTFPESGNSVRSPCCGIAFEG